MHAVTCKTTGCENFGITLILSEVGHYVICGPCGQVIQAIQPEIVMPEVPEPEYEEEGEPNGDT